MVAQWEAMASVSDTSTTTHQPAWASRLTAQGWDMPASNRGVMSDAKACGVARSVVSRASAPGNTSSTFLPLAVGCSTNTASALFWRGSIR
ncbi:hypothetical protein D9M69_539460 [compost metagenome]